MSWPAWRERLLTIVALSANEAPGFVNTGTWRLRTMVVGWQMMWNRPLFGYGVGQHQWNWPASTIGDLMPNPKYAQPIPIHNAFLGVGMDLGVGGMLLLIATIAVAFLQLSRIARAFDSAGQRDLGDLSRALGVAILGMGASMMLYPMAGTFRYYPLYLALAASLWRIEHEGLYHDSR